MQWNAEGVVRKKTKLEHMMRKKTMTYVVYKWPIKIHNQIRSNMNAYMYVRSEQQIENSH